MNRAESTHRARSLTLLWIALSGIAGGASWLACADDGTRPDVVLVTFDTARYDRFGANGDERAHTPTVDAIAARARVFDHAYASAPITLPSHTTMLSGLEPFSHGVSDNARFEVPDDLELLPEILTEEGYETGAFVSAFVLDPRFNLDQGFSVYDSETRRDSSPLDLTVPQRPADEVTDAALAWIGERDGDAPVFLWVHYYDPHHPRDVRPEYADLNDGYRAEIAFADAELGRLLEGLDAARGDRERLLVFTADHGEGLGEHDENTHAQLAYDSTLHVPLMIEGPGIAPGRSDRRVGHVDLVPTILGRLGLPKAEALPGRDVLETGFGARLAGWLGRDDEALDAGYFECLGPHFSMGWAPIRGVRTARWKLTLEPEPLELFDVLDDPDEQRNLVDEHPEVREELEALYARLLETHPAVEARERSLDSEEAEQLAALGYVETELPDVASAPRLDPRRFVSAYGWVGHARSLAREGRYERAIEVLETLSESPAVRSLVLRTLAPVYLEAGRVDAAIATFRRYIELTNSEEARIGLVRALARRGADVALAEVEQIQPPTTRSEILRANLLQELGRSEEAHQVLEAALAGPHQLTTRLRRRAGLVQSGPATPEGEALLRSFVEQAPDDPVLRSSLGFYLTRLDDASKAEEAEALLRAAAVEDPQNPRVHANLGRGLVRLGEPRKARVALEEAVRLDPSRHDDRVRLARVLARIGQPQQALTLVRRALTINPAAPWSDRARELEEKLVADLDAPSDPL